MYNQSYMAITANELRKNTYKNKAIWLRQNMNNKLVVCLKSSVNKIKDVVIVDTVQEVKRKDRTTLSQAELLQKAIN